MELALDLPDSLGVDCNREGQFPMPALEALRDAVQNILLPPSERLLVEKNFYHLWLKNLGKTSKAGKIGAAVWEHSSAFRGMKMDSALAALSLRMKDASERATAFKSLFLAALHSGRATDQLVWPIGHARKELRIDPLVGAMIEDRLAASIKDYDYAPQELSKPERQAVAALACVTLTSDGVTHAQESLAFRAVIAAMDVADLRADELIAMVARGPDSLLEALPGKKARVALISVMRVAFADRVVQPVEIALIRKVANAGNVTNDVFQSYLRHVSLEIGRTMTI